MQLGHPSSGLQSHKFAVTLASEENSSAQHPIIISIIPQKMRNVKLGMYDFFFLKRYAVRPQ